MNPQEASPDILSRPTAAPAGGPRSLAPNTRLLSLDVFRGATIAFMILVNNQGSFSQGYAPLLHGKGYAITPTDWVFPFFLFIVGVAMPFSFARRLELGPEGRSALHRQIFRRAALLFAIGLLLNIYPSFNFGTWRIMGVLQRIALCYLAVSLIVLHCQKRGQVAWLIGLMGAYWILMTLIPFPGRGDNPWNLTYGANFNDYLDRIIFGPFMARPYQANLKGLVSTLPAIGNTLIGFWAGQMLLSSRPPLEKTTRLFAGGTLLLVLGLFWVHWMPFTQRLWTNSFTVYTSGLALLLLAACYWWIDISGRTRGTAFFVTFGRNAILAWVGSQLLAKTLGFVKIPANGESVSLKQWIYDRGLATVLEPANASLLYGLTHVALWWLILVWFHRRSWHWKI